ncbi:ATP-dependent DNA helicase [soil metagenome]
MHPDRAAEDLSEVAVALRRVTGTFASGEERPGQRAMAEAVARAIDEKRHLVVQAGTGTGKSLAYLVPAVLSGRTTVVATATKALQDQLAGKDLPFLAAHLGQRFTSAVLKGRSNYICLQRVNEVAGDDEQLALDGLAERAPAEELAELARWAASTETGDRAELRKEPSPAAWRAVSMTARECPGAQRCAQGEACFTERARRAAGDADVIVVNLHLYGLHLASGAAYLPEHDIVVIDEAHQLEDTISATAGMELGAGRFRALARTVGAIVADDELRASVEAAGDRLAAELSDHVGQRLRGELDPGLVDALTQGRNRLERVQSALRALPEDGPGETKARKIRAVKATTNLADDLDAVFEVPAGDVAWVEGPEGSPTLKVAPVDVADALAGLWSSTTAVLTSATVPVGLARRLGLPAGEHDAIDVGSPFDFQADTLLYCAAHLPDPRSATFDEAMAAELERLIIAAEGRTLALFTSWRALTATVERLRSRLPWPVLAQDDLPKPALVAAFAADEHASLFATMGFWQGIDVPGPSLSLVTIDRLPFPRPDEPLLQARRERARADAFAVVDLPRAATLLAQGAGRLVRTATDRGVVAVLDPRLATARYRWDVINALPPMRRTKDRSEAEAFLRALHEEQPVAP